MLLFVEQGHVVTLIACSPLGNMISHIHNFYCLVKNISLPIKLRFFRILNQNLAIANSTNAA